MSGKHFRKPEMVHKWELDQARQNAMGWCREVERLTADNEWLMELNANLALELAEKDFQLTELRGDN